MSELSKQAKSVLRLAASEIPNLPIEERHELWIGICDLTSEESQLGQAARHNAVLIEQTLKQQETFLSLLN